jgi:UDP-3-O-[3-hydroxymyristoyl] glucosamine N-acyltransferase
MVSRDTLLAADAVTKKLREHGYEPRFVSGGDEHSHNHGAGAGANYAVDIQATKDGKDVHLGKDVAIGPHVVISDGVSLGERTIVCAGTYVGHETKVGADCYIYPNVTLREKIAIGNRVIIHSCSAIGTDGFGYEFSQGRHLKIAQVGIVQIDDDVEIGSCTTIDRARFGRTWIGEGSKIDNLVQIGHNVVLGKHCIIVALVALAGSTRFGDYVTIAGQVGVGGHLEIASKVTLLARAGVTKSITEPGAYLGFPAKPAMEGQRLAAAPAKIPDMLARIKELEKRLAVLEKTAPSAEM